jgi:hypothetical protein
MRALERGVTFPWMLELLPWIDQLAGTSCDNQRVRTDLKLKEHGGTNEIKQP